MSKTIITILAISLFTLGFVACGSGGNESSTEGGGAGDKAGTPADTGTVDAVCICAKGKAGEAIWCEDCSVGYVAKEKVACQGCFAAKTGGPECVACASK